MNNRPTVGVQRTHLRHTGVNRVQLRFGMLYSLSSSEGELQLATTHEPPSGATSVSKKHPRGGVSLAACFVCSSISHAVPVNLPI